MLLISSFSKAEFNQTTLRYISGYDFENKISALFDVYFASLPPPEPFGQPENSYSLCFESSSSAAAQFGFNSAATGTPMMQSPNSATIQAVKNCLNQIIDSVSTHPQGFYIKKIFPDLIFQKLATPGYSYILQQNTMNRFTDDEIKLLISNLVEQFLGTDDVILSYRLINNVDVYRDHLFSTIDKNKNLKETILKLINTLVLRDEFLMY